MSTEKDLQVYLIKECKKLGCVAGKVEMTGARGFPDVFIRTPWSVLLVEVKHPNGTGKLSRHQQNFIAKLGDLGQQVEVIDSFDGANDLLHRIRHNEN